MNEGAGVKYIITDETLKKIEDSFCVCLDDYKRMNRIDPACHVHDIVDFIEDFREND